MEERNGGYYDPNAKPGDYRIQIAPCCVTGERTHVITVLANILEFNYEDGTSDQAQVWVSFSQDGLTMMQNALQASNFPVEAPDPDGIRADLKYYWIAEHNDGSVVAQWPEDKNWSHVRPHEIVCFTLAPKDPESGLPYYRLDREHGFLTAPTIAGPWALMRDRVTGEPLPCPKVPYHTTFRFRPTITFATAPGVSETWPVHVRHEFGWFVDTLHGDDYETLFEIAVEDDGGDWQIHKKEPLSSRHFETDGDGSNPVLPEGPDGPKVIEGNVRIIDAFAGAGV